MMRGRVHPKIQESILTEFMDVQFLAKLDEDLRNLLGDTYDTILRRDRKEQRTRGIEGRHRLAVLVDIVRKHRAGTRDLPLSLLASIGELSSTRSLLTKTRGHPLWSKLISGIKNPNEYPHTLVLLGIAELFERNGAKVVLAPEAQGRICDLRLISPDHEHMNVEVKTPRELFWPTVGIGPATASKHVRKLFYSAGTTASGQLPPVAPGLLVIGGFSLAARIHQIYEAAAQRYFENPPGSYSHIVGVLFSWIGTVMTPADALLDGSSFSMETMLASKTENHLVQNPQYEGHYFIRMV